MLPTVNPVIITDPAELLMFAVSIVPVPLATPLLGVKFSTPAAATPHGVARVIDKSDVPPCDRLSLPLEPMALITPCRRAVMAVWLYVIATFYTPNFSPVACRLPAVDDELVRVMRQAAATLVMVPAAGAVCEALAVESAVEPVWLVIKADGVNGT